MGHPADAAAESRVARRTIDVDGIELRAVEAGEGGRPLLVVHGFTGAKEDFTGGFPRLVEAGWHVVAFDLRGHGESAKPGDASLYTLPALTRDALGVLDALGWSSAVLLGHSLGGVVAQLLALDHPERVDGLVLVDTTHGPQPGIDDDLVAAGVAIVRDGGMQAFLEAARAHGLLSTPAGERKRQADPDYAAWCDEKVLACDPEIVGGLGRELARQADRLERLRSLAIPALVVVGEEDGTLRGDASRLAEAIPGASLRVVAGAGHSPQAEAPDALWSAVEEFLARIPRAREAG